MILHPPALIERYTKAGFWGERTLLDLIDAAAPERPAIVDPPDREALVGTPPAALDWGGFRRAVDAIASGLVRAGVRRDDIVMVQLPNVWELLALYFAVARAGGVISPMPMQWRASELRNVKETSGARLAIGVRRFKDAEPLAIAASLGLETLALEDITAMAAGEVDRAALDARRPGANDIFSLCWSSGTEANAKGCPMSHNNWLFQMRLLPNSVSVAEGDRVLAPAPMVNMTGAVAWISWLAARGTLLLHHPVDVPLLLRQLMTDDVQFTILVPAILNMILKLPQVDQIDLSSVRSIATGSAPPSRWSMEEFKRRWNIEICNLWGQTEGTGLIGGPVDVPDFGKRADHFPWWGKEGTQWAPTVEGLELKLLGEDGQPRVRPEEVGELVYRGPNVFAGYFNRPDLAPTSFTEDGFFRTGDFFVVRDERHIGFFDRKKDMIIRGGFNISAAEVENLVLTSPLVQDVAAVAVPDEVMGEKTCIFVVPKPQQPVPALADIVEHLKRVGVASYKLPERLEIVETIPRNPVGKILKAQLRERIREAATPSAAT